MMMLDPLLSTLLRVAATASSRIPATLRWHRHDVALQKVVVAGGRVSKRLGQAVPRVYGWVVSKYFDADALVSSWQKTPVSI